MTFEEYEFKARLSRLRSADYTYAIMNLGAEAGEVLSLEAKMRRDGYKFQDYLDNMKKELGDVLWHVAIIAYDNGFTLAEVAEANIDKLTSRTARNTISGNGDNR
jgi:NTP pyrophosphatase (non-canonical NTP hydrolase)